MEYVMRYVLTHIDQEEGVRALMTAHQGQYTHETPELAQQALNNIITNNPLKILHHSWGDPRTYEVRPALCRPGGFDPVEIFFDIFEDDISTELATAAHAGTSFVPEKRAQQVRAEYSAHLIHVRQHLEQYATSDEMRIAVTAQFERYRAGYRKHYSAWLGSKSRIMSTMIAGGSNFPVRRMEKRNRTERNRADDLQRWQERAMRAIVRILRPATDPLTDLRAQLAKREARQEQGKAINTIIRKNKRNFPEGAVSGLMEYLKVSEAAARDLLKPDVMGCVGVPDYSLRNNLANIKRIRGRIAELEKKEQVREVLRAEGAEMQALEFKGGRVVENVELDRLQLVFPGKPSEAVRSLLKSNGFRWAPSEGAWQRQLTGNARAAARGIVARIEELS